MATFLILAASVLTGLDVRRAVRPSQLRPRSVTRVSIPLPPRFSLTEPRGRRQVMALSSDGSRLVYAANGMLYVREMTHEEATAVRGTEGATGPLPDDCRHRPDGRAPFPVHGAAAVAVENYIFTTCRPS